MANRTRIERRQRALRRMAAIPREIRREIAPALVKAADDHVKRMKALAPKDSGDLEKSIRREAGDVVQSNSRVRGVGGTVRGDPELTQNVVAGDDEAWYARLVEFGVGPSAGDASGKGARGPVPASPFFFPVVRLLRKRTRSALNRAIRKAIQRAANR